MILKQETSLIARNRFQGPGFIRKNSPYWIVKKTLRLVNTGNLPDGPERPPPVEKVNLPLNASLIKPLKIKI
jgi:hypothetical protein